MPRRTPVLVGSLLLLAATLLPPLAPPAAADTFAYWNSPRTSALQPGGLVTLRVENPYGPGIVNTVLFLDGGAVTEIALTPVMDGPSTLSAQVPGPVDGRRYYGFRLQQGEQLDLLPVRLASGAAPTPGQLSLVATDPVGDQAVGGSHLDLIEYRVGSSETHLYAALRNAGGGFPIVSGLTFFSYLLGLSNPAEADPDTVWALIQTYSQPGVIGPGLYRVTGTGLADLQLIGPITVQTYAAEDMLVLSCLLSDLLGDPALAAWLGPGEPRLAVGAFTQRITLLGGTVEADRAAGGRVYLRGVGRDPGPNSLPQLDGLVIAPAGPDAAADVVYTDPDGHCPVLAQIVLDGAGYPLYPQTLDYAGPVVYRTAPGVPPLVAGGWSTATAEFSDNGVDIVSLGLVPVAVADESPRHGVQLRLDAAPNPSTGQTVFSFELPSGGPIRLTVHDAAGRLVAVLADGERAAGRNAVAWDGRDRWGRVQAAGVYFYRLQSREGIGVQRISIVR